MNDQVIRVLDQDPHVAVRVPISSRHLETHKDFIATKVSHSSPDKQAPADQAQHVFPPKFYNGIRAPERILNRNT